MSEHLLTLRNSIGALGAQHGDAVSQRPTTALVLSPSATPGKNLEAAVDLTTPNVGAAMESGAATANGSDSLSAVSAVTQQNALLQQKIAAQQQTINQLEAKNLDLGTEVNHLNMRLEATSSLLQEYEVDVADWKTVTANNEAALEVLQKEASKMASLLQVTHGKLDVSLRNKELWKGRYLKVKEDLTSKKAEWIKLRTTLEAQAEGNVLAQAQYEQALQACCVLTDGFKAVHEDALKVMESSTAAGLEMAQVLADFKSDAAGQMQLAKVDCHVGSPPSRGVGVEVPSLVFAGDGARFEPLFEDSPEPFDVNLLRKMADPLAGSDGPTSFEEVMNTLGNAKDGEGADDLGASLEALTLQVKDQHHVQVQSLMTERAQLMGYVQLAEVSVKGALCELSARQQKAIEGAAILAGGTTQAAKGAKRIGKAANGAAAVKTGRNRGDGQPPGATSAPTLAVGGQPGGGEGSDDSGEDHPPRKRRRILNAAGF